MSPRIKSPAIEEFRLHSIREAATRVIAREGIEGATMQDIADEAQIAKGTLYLYFKDRDDLIRSVGDETLEVLRERMDEVFALRLPFAEALPRIVGTQFAFFEENREIFRVYHETVERSRGAKRHRECHHHYQHYLDQLASALRRAMAARQIRRGDPARLALFIAEGVVAIIVLRFGEAKPKPVASDVELVVSTLLQGLRPGRRRD